MTPVDPNLGASTPGTDAAVAQRLASQAKRIGALERQATVYTGSGAPTQAARDGALYVDTTGSKLYVRCGAAWKSTTLT